ncbi:NAD(P)/FAD-dependent oxidoreductase [Nocardioides sp. HDW12B]|uniref:flavin-containing monooxygenase n=1 Tax=Nocardioides sp. HDW12B TaxID=2714939 RepID=UPI00140C897C|nr:NAD(P)/FAD-dependent oxidoreductase [Nocardioides sp. HDW12B]QIK65238.1 NAD(P)/FAD-dependent oxidoreductase [Nocardioides sp. HDW12B]
MSADTAPATATSTEHLDVLVVGGGLSGVGAGYRLQTECLDKTYAILESRDALGGTWDLFRYPGIRSDSDIFTLAYPFEPWREKESIVDGAAIRRYIEHTATKHGIDRHIRLQRRVVAADWSTADQRWTVTVESTDPASPGTSTLTCSFLYACSGYYDYAEPYAATIPGIADFGGQVVHPQFWPEDLEYAGKRVVVIGSGATAVTLVPSMAGEAEHVTMLQRTPSWIAVAPRVDKLANSMRERLPAPLAHRLIRTKNVLVTQALFQFCQRFPAQAKKLLLQGVEKGVGAERFDPADFTAPYDPWDQRLCLVPSGDLFKAIRRGDADIVTDRIAGFTADAVTLESGRELPADVVVTATGLQMQLFGGVRPSVDGETVTLNEQFVWRGAMITGLPNFAICVGYTNASWTLRADLSSRLVCKILRHLDARDLGAVVPPLEEGLTERPLLDLSSGYVTRALPHLPRQGDSGVWRVRQNYVVDAATTLRTDLDATLEAIPHTAARSTRTTTVPA